MKTTALTATLKGAIKRNGYNSMEFSDMIGLPYATLNYRYKHPATWRFCEWGAVLRHLTLNESEEKTIRNEIRKL